MSSRPGPQRAPSTERERAKVLADAVQDGAPERASTRERSAADRDGREEDRRRDRESKSRAEEGRQLAVAEANAHPIRAEHHHCDHEGGSSPAIDPPHGGIENKGIRFSNVRITRYPVATPGRALSTR